jgi:aldehyde:ferredoxin oxidoreductase
MIAGVGRCRGNGNPNPPDGCRRRDWVEFWPRGCAGPRKPFGKGAHRYAAHVKGLELTAYHPAAILGSALGYAVSSRGGDYNNVYSSLEHRWPARKGADAFGSPESVDTKRPSGKGG